VKTSTTFANKCLHSSLVLCFVLAFVLTPMTGCGADEIISGLQVADQVANAANSFLAPVNPDMGKILATVDSDLKTVIKAYQDYESALPADKATKGDLIKATVGTIQTNLTAILAGVGVKNPNLLRDINIAVAVVNSALIIVLSKVSGTTAQAAVVGGPNLPIITGARNHKDLKNAWNTAIKVDFPNAVVK